MRRAVALFVLTGALLLPLAAATPSHAGPGLLRALRFGDRGPQVAALQEQLRSAGFDPGAVDGVFGPRTEAAVRAAQASMGVTVDGLAGQVTLQGLHLDARPTAEEVRLVVHAAVPAAVTAAAPTPTGARQAPTGAFPAPSAARSAVAGAGAGTGPSETAAPATEESRQFALTFNGSPDPELLPRLLALLQEHQMQATFFVRGEAAEGQPDLVARIAAAGHEVATQGYADLDMTGISAQMQTAQLRRSIQAVQQATGRAPQFFRPAQGRFDAALLQRAEAEGLRPVLWTNVGMAGSAEPTPERLREHLRRSVYPGAILMLHQDRAASLAALESLLPKLEAEGYRSVGLSRLLDPAPAKLR